MSVGPANSLRDRVRAAADQTLKRSPVVSPFDILMNLNWLHSSHVERWQNRHPDYDFLERHMQSTPDKRAKVFGYFLEWVAEKSLTPIEANYTAKSVRAREPLRVTAAGNPEDEEFFRTHYARPDLTEKKTEKLKEKLSAAPEITVFVAVGASRACSECSVEISEGDLSVVECNEPLCLSCADLDHLVFLAAGDATLTRRAKKASSLSAVVVRFNRRRNRYERQGILVTEDAVAKAEAQCEADAPERAERRVKAAESRSIEDQELVADMTSLIVDLFPNCPAKEAEAIAAHTAVRGSGRVGRTAAGRSLDEKAVTLAVIAHIRHEHTDYDEQLMQGVERRTARQRIADAVNKKLAAWRGKR